MCKLNSENQKLVNNISLALQQISCLSLQDLIRKYNKSWSNVWKIEAKLGYKSYQVQKVPNRRDKQNKNARKAALKSYNEALTKLTGCVIQDDETYLK
jgi:hypothetical protein